MKALALLAMTSLTFVACGPKANFNPTDARFKSLLDGQSVEVVSNQDLDSSIGSDDSATSGPTSTNTRSDDGSATEPNTDEPSTEPTKKAPGHTCKDRILKQDKEKHHSEMITSPQEIEDDSSIGDAIACDKKQKKFYVCHFPNADYSKRKTLCLPRPAIEAHLEHLGAKRNSGHADYAGPCRDQDGNIIDSHGDEAEQINAE